MSIGSTPLKSKRNVVVDVNKDFKNKLEELKMAVEEKRYSNVKEILGVLEKHLQDYHINPTKKKKFRELCYTC